MDETRRVPAFAMASAFLLALAGWCVQHGYIGVGHDGMLYAFQAIATEDRAQLLDDLYLRYGSQDSYTIFSPVYRAVFALFGFEYGAMAMVVAGQALWIAAALGALWALVGRRDPLLFAVAAVFLAAMEPHYGVTGALIYAEGFATPRLWAEALSLLGVLCLLNRRWAAAALVFAVSFTLHPIMTLVALAFVFLCLAAVDWRWLLAAPAGLALLSLGIVLEIGPLKDALARFDPEWLEIVQLRSPQLFVDGWPFITWLAIYERALILAAAAALSDGPLRRFFLAGIAAFIIGVAATWIGADVMENVLIVQIQPWRIFWPAHALAMVGLALIVVRASEAPAPGRRPMIVAAVALALSVATIDLTPVGHIAAVAAALAVLIIVMMRRAKGRAASALRFILAAAALAACALGLGFSAQNLIRGAALLDEGMRRAGGLPLWVGTLPALAALGALAIAFLRRRAPWRFMTAAAAVVAVAGLASWDRRTAWSVYVEENFGTLGDGALSTPPEGIVFWQGQQAALSSWFGLLRKTYLSWPQGAGVVFNRGTAIEYERRSRLAEPIDDSATGYSFERRLRARPTPTPADMRAICADEAAPSLFVLATPVKGVAGRIWRPDALEVRLFTRDPGSEEGDWATRDIAYVTELHLYECGDFAG